MNRFNKGWLFFALISLITLLSISYGFYFSENKTVLKDSQNTPSIHSVETPIAVIDLSQQKTLSEQSVIPKNNKFNLEPRTQTVHPEEQAPDSHVKTEVSESEQGLSGQDNELTEKDEVAEDLQTETAKPTIQKMPGLETQTLKMTSYAGVNKIKPGDPGYQNLINKMNHNSDF